MKMGRKQLVTKSHIFHTKRAHIYKQPSQTTSNISLLSMAVLKYLQDVCDLRVSEKNKISLYKITQNVTVSYRINDQIQTTILITPGSSFQSYTMYEI